MSAEGESSRAPIPAHLASFLAVLVEVARARGEAGFQHTPESAREALKALTQRLVTQSPEIRSVREGAIPSPSYPVPVRLYHPAPEERLPVALLVHGGGGVAGSIDVYDPIARKLALASRRLVVSVEYRLAPENPHPAGLEDVLACIRGVFGWLHDNFPDIDFEPRLALVGDSGGAGLCAGAAHRPQERRGQSIDRMVLIYPSLDYTLSLPSVDENGQGYFLERERIEWLLDRFFPPGTDRRAQSPAFMPVPPDFPPTLVATAGYCPLRDEGIAYVKRLKDAGVPSVHLPHPSLIHAFLNMEDLVPDACQDLYARTGAFLRT
jgi:acetyl esterase